ncbi:hypothetical protein RFN29_13175 [Mesorhizobium sp. VK22B]|uniref:Uncharacterized protein n=1 Tax=Mesorhizobium captivum TaxID=3072319 RepID=A0ABU4Z017_9HYPH|nr:MULTISPECIES: hypothetical protein [unclassified Mesorhizobium]MDX8492529.1 hypothetical protein [Mesorhizobium sp. VK22B]MDX8505618.1 hypothetical protein [Mesorhizobium sp. VK22E]
MTLSSRDGADAELLSDAIGALRELTLRVKDSHDRSFDDGNSADTWQSDELRDAISRAEAVIAKAQNRRE